MKTLLFASLLVFCGAVHGTVFGRGPVRKYYYHSVQNFLPFHWLRAHHVTCNKTSYKKNLQIYICKLNYDWSLCD